MMKSQYKKHREKAVKENSSKFTEDFAKQCRDIGETESYLGIQLFIKSKAYNENYDKIDWS